MTRRNRLSYFLMLLSASVGRAETRVLLKDKQSKPVEYKLEERRKGREYVNGCSTAAILRRTGLLYRRLSPQLGTEITRAASAVLCVDSV